MSAKSETAASLKALFEEVNKNIKETTARTISEVNSNVNVQVQELQNLLGKLEARLDTIEKLSGDKKKQVKAAAEKPAAEEVKEAPAKKTTAKEEVKVAKNAATFFRELFQSDADFKKKVLTEELHKEILAHPKYTTKKTQKTKDNAEAELAYNYITSDANLEKCKEIRAEFEARLKGAAAKPAQLVAEPHTP